MSEDDLTIKEITEAVLDLAKNKGVGTKPNEVSVAEKIALIHSEISEAYEAYRRKNIKGKDGFKEELADALIRICHLAGIFKINLSQEISKKMKRNQGRTWDKKRLNEMLKVE
jgi:NTP pyrophosphatase (non-canonical NTP hydrolase)